MPAFALVAAALIAQSPQEDPGITLPWIPLLFSQKEGIDVKWRWVLHDKKFWIEFNNLGKEPIHFNYYLNNIQSKNDTCLNQRIHLLPVKKSGETCIVAIPSVRGLTPSSIPAPTNIRQGVIDEGPFLSDKIN